MATPDILQAALTALSEGRLDEARQGFERVLAAEPDHPAALHWVAVIAYQQPVTRADVEAIRAVYSAIAAHDLPGQAAWSLVIAPPGSAKTETTKPSESG